MPKVGKIEVIFNKNSGKKVYDLWYSQTDNFHLKGLPSDFIELTGFQPDCWQTEASLRDNLRLSVEKYQKLLSTERKVIIFRVCASTELTMNKVREGNYSGYKHGISRKISSFGFGSPDYAVGIEYRLYKEIDNGGKKYYPLLENGGTGLERIITSDQSIIEWTEERELFFKGVYASMQSLVLKLAQFFTDDLDKTVARIDSVGGNAKLLS